MGRPCWTCGRRGRRTTAPSGRSRSSSSRCRAGPGASRSRSPSTALAAGCSTSAWRGRTGTSGGPERRRPCRGLRGLGHAGLPAGAGEARAAGWCSSACTGCPRPACTFSPPGTALSRAEVAAERRAGRRCPPAAAPGAGRHGGCPGRRPAVARRRLPRPHPALRRRAAVGGARRAGGRGGSTSWPSPTTTRPATTASSPPWASATAYGCCRGRRSPPTAATRTPSATSASSTSANPATRGRPTVAGARRTAVGQPPAGGGLLLAARAGRAHSRWPRSGTRRGCCGRPGAARSPGGRPGAGRPCPSAAATSTAWARTASPDRRPRGSLCEDGDVLGAVAAGRTAVSADPRGPLLLRCGDELVAVGAEGALLTGPDRGRRVVPGDRARFPAAPGPWWLEDHRAQVLALCP